MQKVAETHLHGMKEYICMFAYFPFEGEQRSEHRTPMQVLVICEES